MTYRIRVESIVMHLVSLVCHVHNYLVVSSMYGFAGNLI